MESKKGYNFSIDRFDSLKLVSRLTAQSIQYDSLYHWTINNYQIRDFEGMEEKITRNLTRHHHPDCAQRFHRGQDRPADDDHSATSPSRQEPKERDWATSRLSRSSTIHVMPPSFQHLSDHHRGLTLGTEGEGGMGLNIGIVGAEHAYILFMTISSSFAVKGNMSPFVAAWIPNVVFIGIAFYLYKKAPN
jgi:lipopolysaccharide export system permease protein